MSLIGPYQSLQFVHAQDCSEEHGDAVWGVKWTTKDRVVSVSADGSVKQWDTASGQTLAARPPHTIGIGSLSVSPTGTHALYNSLEGLTALWDLETNELVGSHESYTRTSGSGEQGEPAWSVSLHPSGETYAATGASGKVTIHSAGPSNFGERVAKLDSGRSRMGMFATHSPDGKRLALSLETGQIFIFDLTAQALAATYTAHAAAVRSLAWSADGEQILSASDDRRLTLFDVRASPSGKPGAGAVAALVGHGSWVLSAAFSPDGRLALSGSADKTIKVWDIGARAAVSTIQDTGEVWSVSWRPQAPAPGTAGAFVTGGEDGFVKWWRSAGAS
ncbi:hypothetical protein EW145_g2850 [Phellinidium pouzarii]|uniref:Uncharacterized protein n=1 Tax=Phellinidium pouzarii TaxID=167371 RepID=A0A4S4L9V3_9AGAM|nr:hypothetical protein EW145_g2850 [Phellinidium pouzarii]